MALSLIGAVVGEFVGSNQGFGYLIVAYSSTMNTALVFGAVVLLALMGILFFYAVVRLNAWSGPGMPPAV